ncbi:MAG: hypothetical protein BWY11_00212 [Firmicutes bacterium ADurb.Bin182]|nr:MAG: hypothetical protein BWY11_00212 [Firmicutes bacterium ADurb.Bin182]
MQHRLKISIGKGSEGTGIVRCQKLTLKDRLLRRLFGETNRVMVIVPGNSVKTLAIQEVADGQDE